MSSLLSVHASVLAAAILATTALGANAAVFTTAGTPIPLSTLDTPGNSIDIGGLTFYNFAVIDSTGDMPAASDVYVTPETITVDSQTTVGFKLSGGFVDTGLSSGASDFLLDYNVMTDDGSASITDAHIQGNPEVFGAGLASVTDTFVPDTGATIAISNVTSNMASVDFTTAFADLSVQKDIVLFVPNLSGSYATLSFVDQTYSTNGVGSGVPEPASLALLALGAAGLLARRRRS